MAVRKSKLLSCARTVPGVFAYLIFLSFISPVCAQVRTLGDVSFAVPPGWQYEQPSNDDRATLSTGTADNISVIAVFKPLHATGHSDADFTTAWTQLIRTMTPPTPIYDYTSTAGYSGSEGGENTEDGSHHVFLYLLEAPSSAIPVMVVTANRRTFDELQPAISQFVEGIRLAPLQAQAVKTNVMMSDLEGEWHTGGESSLNYVTDSGAYAGSSTVAHGAGYVIAPDGNFTYNFAGVSNHQIVRGKGSGKVELGDGFLTLREPTQNRVTKYHIISYQTALNGATILTLLTDSYEVTGPNISYYAEKWIRDRK